LKYSKTLLLVLFSFFLSADILLAQDSDALFIKYLAYKDRLNEEFIDIGEGPGKMLIPGMINPAFEPSWGSYCKIDPKGKGKVHFGDVTYRMGDYMAVLATEFRLFRDNGHSTKQTLREIFYTLKAIERLDSLAEHALYGIPSVDKSYEKNGYIVRDDISIAALKDSKWKNFKWASSDFGCSADERVKLKNAPSHDQIISLLFGLRMLTALVPEGTMYGEADLNYQARLAADRIIQYLRKNEWTVVSPIDARPVPRGAYAQYQCYAIAEAGHRMTGRNYHTSWSSGLGKMSWLSAQYPFRTLSRFKFYNPYFGKKIRIIYDDVGNAMMLRLATMSNTWRDSKIKSAAITSDLEVFLLVHQLLNDSELDIDSEFFLKQLRQAPMEGPKYFGLTEPHKWNSRDRWSHPESVESGTIYPDFYGKYPGLDFMLLHNLYCLVYEVEVSLDLR